MSNVKVIKGSLFDAPKGSILCHAVNCQGVWGAGIAAQFRKRFPDAYSYYNRTCKENGASLLGSCLLAPEGDFTIGCLFTSVGYGSNVSSVPEILDATSDALGDMFWQMAYPVMKNPIHMCKINSGLFGVEWNYTREILEEDFSDHEFTVWEI